MMRGVQRAGRCCGAMFAVARGVVSGVVGINKLRHWEIKPRVVGDTIVCGAAELRRSPEVRRQCRAIREMFRER